jgi:hypothetical protein
VVIVGVEDVARLLDNSVEISSKLETSQFVDVVELLSHAC